MTPTLAPLARPAIPLNGPVSFPENLPYEDGVPMESSWQRDQMNLLIHILETNWKGRRFYCGGNMFVHYSAEQVRNREFHGPDFFVVLNVDHDRPRKYWAVWEELGRYPNAIVELLSPTTANEDRTTKKDIYEQTFGTREYFCYDPAAEQLEGWRLSKYYRAIPTEQGRMWSEELELWLGTSRGTWNGKDDLWLRFFDREGTMLLTDGEKFHAAEAENERLRKELDALRQQLKTTNP